ARLSRDRRLTKRRILKDVGPLRFGEGHDTTFPYALALATGAEYDWLMGSSGAAFTTTIDEAGWDPLAAAPRDALTLARAARAAGVRLDPATPPLPVRTRATALSSPGRRRCATTNGGPMRSTPAPPHSRITRCEPSWSTSGARRRGSFVQRAGCFRTHPVGISCARPSRTVT